MNLIENIMDVLVSYLIPIISLIISAIALYQSNKSRKLEKQIQNLELYIKQYQAKEIENIENTPKEAKIKAKVYEITPRKHKLKIWNSGNKRAFNIVAKIPDEYNILQIESEKYPYEYLDPGESFETSVAFHKMSCRKFQIITEWEDENKQAYSNKQLGSI